VRVTNVKTGSSALVRITDRGPFIPGRVLDLSLAAARKVDVWQPGVAQVKVELLQSGASAESSGKWAVQIGGFPDESVASKLADRLTRRYHTAKVLRFASPAGDWWIRVRVLDDDHERAQKLAAEKSKIAAQSKFTSPIVTQIVPLKKFYKAEGYHQNYYNNHPDDPYPRNVIRPKVEKIEKELQKGAAH
jgi:rare lipoprotein A